MTTVAQMIEWLKSLPQDAEVTCGREENYGYTTAIEFCPVDIDGCLVLDYSSPEDRKLFPRMAGKVLVEIVS